MMIWFKKARLLYYYLFATLFSINAAFGISELIIKNNHGGSVDLFLVQVDQARQAGTRIIFAVQCDSACALFLSLPREQLCLTKDAHFGFHKAFTPFFRTSFDWSRRYGDWVTQKTFLLYPKWVKSWIINNGGLTDEVKTMPYSYASRYLPVCNS